jgi:hypothetical protein
MLAHSMGSCPIDFRVGIGFLARVDFRLYALIYGNSTTRQAVQVKMLCFWTLVNFFTGIKNSQK